MWSVFLMAIRSCFVRTIINVIFSYTCLKSPQIISFHFLFVIPFVWPIIGLLPWNHFCHLWRSSYKSKKSKFSETSLLRKLIVYSKFQSFLSNFFQIPLKKRHNFPTNPLGFLINWIEIIKFEGKWYDLQ
jgi:hypothetical protein